MSSEIIGVDAAKLAGLQIDQLSKIRSGQLSLDQLERFLNLKPEDREERFSEKHPVPIVETAKPVIMTRPVPQFVFVADLGIITVPEGYNHATFLSDFYERNKEKFCRYNKNITDANFPNPTRILKPGDKLSVRAFQHAVGMTTFSWERIAFIAEQKGVLLGAQGAALLFEQNRNIIKKGDYLSFDEKERLWKESPHRCAHHHVPLLRVSGDGYEFNLGAFEPMNFDHSNFFIFCDMLLA